ncbi:MAG: hemerythrin domain-containing protein [Aquabacterium sp.]
MHDTNDARFDLYAAIHKALRLAMADTLARLGSLDVADTGPCQGTAAQVQSLLDMCRGHLQKEERYVHPLIEARCAGRSLRIAAEHVEHQAAIDALEAGLVAFRCAPSAVAGHRLYRRLAVFVAENLAHMEYEESVHNEALWASCTDEDLLAVHDAILAGLEPAEAGEVLHWMLPALSHEERAGMLAGMRAMAPPPAFEGAVQLARQRLSAGEWAKLAQALQLQPA